MVYRWVRLVESTHIIFDYILARREREGQDVVGCVFFCFFCIPAASKGCIFPAILAPPNGQEALLHRAALKAQE